MNLEKELLKTQSLVQCNRIIKYIGNDEIPVCRPDEIIF